MELPGGIRVGGELRRDFAFKPVTGAMELMLAECGSGPDALANRVTTALATALATMGGEPPDHDAVHGLSINDRQFLMRQLAAHVGVDDVWLTAKCRACSEPFDIFVRQSELPVKAAGSDYPFTECETAQGTLRLRVPTGRDQEALDGMDDEVAERALAQRLLTPREGSDVRRPEDLELSDVDLARIEQAVETMAPEVATEAAAHCPHCGESNRVNVDPYLCLQMTSQNLFSEIHNLSVNYHWSEADILALPRERRRVYLQLIDRSRGLKNQPAAFDARG